MSRMARFTALCAAMAVLGGCNLTPTSTVTLWSENGHGKQDAQKLKDLLEKLGTTTLASVEDERLVAKIRTRSLDRAQLAALVKPHTLGFHFLVDDQGPLSLTREETEGSTCQAIESLGAKVAVPGNQRVTCICAGQRTPARCRLVLMERDAVLTGRMLSEAFASLTAQGDPEVSMAFDDEGRRLLAEVTRSGVGRFLAVVLDGKALIAPRINEPIEGGRLRMTLGTQVGDKNAQFVEAYDLSIALKAAMLEGRWAVQDVTR